MAELSELSVQALLNLSRDLSSIISNKTILAFLPNTENEKRIVSGVTIGPNGVILHFSDGDSHILTDKDSLFVWM